MYSLKCVLSIAFLLFVQYVEACDLYDTNNAACDWNLEKLCGMESFPTTIQGLYDSRSCLRSNREFLTSSCEEYLELDKPSIIDSCYTEMKDHCNYVTPGSFRIHACLSGVPTNELSNACQAALTYDQKLIEEKGGGKILEIPMKYSFWTLWSTYLSIIRQEVSLFQNVYSGLPMLNYLRGSVVTPPETEESNDVNEDGAEGGNDDQSDDYISKLELSSTLISQADKDERQRQKLRKIQVKFHN